MESRYYVIARDTVWNEPGRAGHQPLRLYFCGDRWAREKGLATRFYPDGVRRDFNQYGSSTETRVATGGGYSVALRLAADYSKHMTDVHVLLRRLRRATVAMRGVSS